MRKIVAIVFLAIIGFYIISIFSAFQFGDKYKGVSEHYVKEGIIENRGANLVTSIVVNYRGFDTLGEVTVLFLAATGLSFLLFSCKCEREFKRIKSSLVLRTATDTLFPMILLFGAYIFIHGHLTPGGGFQGGSVIASGVMLLFLSFRSFHPNHKTLSTIEVLAGISFAGIGLLGLVYAKSFLANSVLPLGQWNRLISAGVIPLIYIAVGLKVGAELSGLISDMISTTKED